MRGSRQVRWVVDVERIDPDKRRSLAGQQSRLIGVMFGVGVGTFHFDLLEFTDKSAGLLYPRHRTYAPIKNANGDKSPATACAALLAYDKLVYAELFGKEAPSTALELDPQCYYPTDVVIPNKEGLYAH